MKRAFTLAEVLISLGIIGVVAAMTLPTVVNSYQKKQTAIKLRYSYNIINNAFKAAVADYGDMKNWDYISSLDDVNARKAFIDKYLIPYIKGAKPSERSGYNYLELGYKNPSVPSQPNGAPIGLSAQNYYPIALINGIYFYFGNNGNFEIDINGTAKPNIWGRDLFEFSLDYNKNRVRTARPANYSIDTIKEQCKKNGLGTACSSWIEKNNWEIPDDESYPW